MDSEEWHADQGSEVIPRDPSDLILRSLDHPEANGRQAVPGEHVWTYIVPLENGVRLRLQLGAESRRQFVDLIAMDIVDDLFEG